MNGVEFIHIQIMKAEQALAEARTTIIHPLTTRVVREADTERYQAAMRRANESSDARQIARTRVAFRSALSALEVSLRQRGAVR